MKNIQKKITDIGWQQMATEEINENGMLWCHDFYRLEYCDELIGKYDNSDHLARPLRWKSFTLRTISSSSAS